MKNARLLAAFYVLLAVHVVDAQDHRPMPATGSGSTPATDSPATRAAPTNFPTASDPESWRENYAYTLGVQAYIFGFPYINLATLRWQWVTQAPPPGPSHDLTPYVALNHFFHFRKLADASYRGGGGPNNDTFYSMSWIDLKDGPVILTHPDLGDRYFLFQFACIDGDNFAAVGSRPTGSKAGSFAIIGPNWQGELPPGVTALPRSRSNSVYLLGRTLVDGPVDAPAVIKLQDQYSLVPLSLWGKANATLPESRDVWKPFDAKTDPLADWKTMSRAMTEDPPEERLSKLLGLFARVGIGPGQDVETQDEATKRGLARAAIDGRQLILDVNRSKNPFMGEKINGWSIPPSTFGRYGLVDDFLLRAVLCHAGIITPWAEDAYATNTTTDINGDLVDGGNRYIIHFAPDKVPKVHGFWSLTLYDSTFNLTPNPIDRYSIGNRTRGLKLDADGGLTVYLQHESPGKDKESNWLPSPPSGIFTLTFRAYWPDNSVAERKWSPPGVTPVP
jgi:hypothetical protein